MRYVGDTVIAPVEGRAVRKQRMRHSLATVVSQWTKLWVDGGSIHISRSGETLRGLADNVMALGVYSAGPIKEPQISSDNVVARILILRSIRVAASLICGDRTVCEIESIRYLFIVDSKCINTHGKVAADSGVR